MGWKCRSQTQWIQDQGNNKTAKNLGVTLDSKFIWKPQVEAVTKKVNRSLYSLNFFRHLTIFKLRKRLVSALALSHRDYCSTVYSNISGDLKLQLQKLQNKCVIYVTGLRRNEHVTPARRQLGWLTTDMPLGYWHEIACIWMHTMKSLAYESTITILEQLAQQYTQNSFLERVQNCTFETPF